MILCYDHRMFNLTCEICKEDYQAITTVSRVCSAKCRQKRYRLTSKGRSKVDEYNLNHYKRETVTRLCCNCNRVFETTRKNKTFCSNQECIRKSKYLAQVRSRSKNIKKHRARDIVIKRIKRGISLTRQPCSVCGTLDAEAHHNDYNQPLDVIWLCKRHHTDVHRNGNKYN